MHMASTALPCARRRIDHLELFSRININPRLPEFRSLPGKALIGRRAVRALAQNWPVLMLMATSFPVSFGFRRNSRQHFRRHGSRHAEPVFPHTGAATSQRSNPDPRSGRSFRMGSRVTPTYGLDHRRSTHRRTAPVRERPLENGVVSWNEISCRLVSRNVFFAGDQPRTICRGTATPFCCPLRGEVRIRGVRLSPSPIFPATLANLAIQSIPRT